MNTTRVVEPWEIEWTDDQISRFWKWYVTNSALAGNYFSEQLGDALLAFVDRRIKLGGTIVDWGAGAGHFTEKLVRRNLATLAIDSSEASVAFVQQKLRAAPNFLGAVAYKGNGEPLPAVAADAVFLLEAVEHTHDPVLDATLNDIAQILKPGGHIVVTTPNAENLAEAQVMCPNCGCVFHTMQHVRSFHRQTLRQLMRRVGFAEVSCEATLLSAHVPWLRPLQRWYYVARQRKMPNLIYIGRKR